MIIQNFEIIGPTESNVDILLFGDICDPDTNEIVATFGENGTSFNEWFLSLDDMTRQDIIVEILPKISYSVYKKSGNQ